MVIPSGSSGITVNLLWFFAFGATVRPTQSSRPGTTSNTVKSLPAQTISAQRPLARQRQAATIIYGKIGPLPDLMAEMAHPERPGLPTKAETQVLLLTTQTQPITSPCGNCTAQEDQRRPDIAAQRPSPGLRSASSILGCQPIQQVKQDSGCNHEIRFRSR